MFKFSGRREAGAAKEQLFIFGAIVRAIWPDKPALRLSQRLECSERAAQFYIDGERKLSAKCIAVIIAEILHE